MSDRYVVRRESESGHCCFGATVIDTASEGANVCECFEVGDAERIARALNLTPPEPEAGRGRIQMSARNPPGYGECALASAGIGALLPWATNRWRMK